MSAKALRAAAPERRIEWLSKTSGALLAASFSAREALSQSSGLSAPMVDWASKTTLETFTPKALRALFDEAMESKGEPIDSLSVVLASNVFTAAARGVMVPLLLGIPVRVKASSRETTFPNLLCDALRSTDSELGGAMELRTFAGGDLEAEAALVDETEVTAIYGSDETVDAIRTRHPGASLIAHGHGVSVAFCDLASMQDQARDQAAEALALDICAYDQRGCLSPQIICIVEGNGNRASTFAQTLAAHMDALSSKLPRGPLPLEVGAAQTQWRGLAEVEGVLLAGDDRAVAVRPSHPIRWSPGYRNVSVTVVESVNHAVYALESLGKHLKCVGADPASLESVRSALDATPELAVYACPLGTMQTPPLDAPADGQPIWYGLLR